MANPIHQFEIQTIVPFHVGGVDLSLTNSALWMIIGTVLSVSMLRVAMSRSDLVPGRGQMLAELTYEFIAKMVRDNIGPKGRQYFPFVFTLFMFVLMGNLLGLLPYSFTYTSHLAVTGMLALIVFATVIVAGIYNHGLHFFHLFMPSGVPIWLMPLIIPIEIVSFFVRPMTLSVRLFANMMAGHIMLKVVAAFAVGAIGMGGAIGLLSAFPVMINVIMMVFELLVAMIQAYVFALLVCVYLKDSVELHH